MSAWDEAARLVEQTTPDERRWCLDGDVPFWAGSIELGRGGYHRRPCPAGEVPRLGIPGFRFADGPRGVVIAPATAFPVSMARARRGTSTSRSASATPSAGSRGPCGLRAAG